MALQTNEQRFWSKVDRSGGPESCWLWVAGKSHGYGAFFFEGKLHGAHSVDLNDAETTKGLDGRAAGALIR